MSRFQFVADNSATFEVKRLCELVQIERSSYYAWKAGAPARAVRGHVRFLSIGSSPMSEVCTELLLMPCWNVHTQALVRARRHALACR